MPSSLHLFIRHCLIGYFSGANWSHLNTSFLSTESSISSMQRLLTFAYLLFHGRSLGRKKAGSKLNVGLDADGYLPAFMDMTKGKDHEIKWARTLNLPKGSFVCYDRGFTDYQWYNQLASQSIFFVARLKKNAEVKYLLKRPGRKSSGISNDQTIRLKGVEKELRLVCVYGPGNRHQVPICNQRPTTSKPKRLLISTRSVGRSSCSSSGSSKT